MKQYLNLIKSLFIDAILPAACPACGENNDSFDTGFCPTCFKQISFIRDPLCNICGSPFPFSVGKNMVCQKCMEERPFFEISRSLLVYDDFSKDMILAFKHADATYNALFFAKIMASAFKNIINDADVVMPVPLHPLRLFKRKYNQAALLALNIAKLSGKVYLPDTLVRTKNTKSQGSFDAKERLENVKNVFKIKGQNNIRNKHVILIDDVFTTGSTVNECAKSLLKSDAIGVTVLTIAKTVNNHARTKVNNND